MATKWRMLFLVHVAFAHAVVIYVGWTHCTDKLHKKITQVHRIFSQRYFRGLRTDRDTIIGFFDTVSAFFAHSISVLQSYFISAHRTLVKPTSHVLVLFTGDLLTYLLRGAESFLRS